MTKSVGIINLRSPYGHMVGKEAQDLALIFGSYEQDVAMYFIGDGVYHLIENQTPELINAKNYLKTYEAFSFYDIEHVYACANSMKDRGVCNVPSFVTVLSSNEMRDRIKQHQVVFNF